MPRKDIDYSKSVIYKIVPDDLSLDYVYVGSTTNFIKRKFQHKNSCNNPNDRSYNIKLYNIIRQNGGWCNFKILIIEEYPCNLKHELLLRERFYFELLNSNLNSNYPNRNKNEYIEQNKEKIKEYYIQNKEKLNEQKKEYYIQNKEKLNERYKKYYEQNIEKMQNKNKKYYKQNKEKITQPYTCECSKTFQICSKSTHIKTIFHKTYIKNNPSQSN